MTVSMGFDLSMTSSGWAVASLFPEFHPYTGVVKSQPAPIAERTPNVKARRLDDIIYRATERARFHRPEVAVIESPVPNGRMKTGMLLERGAIYHGVLMRLDALRIRIYECAPKQRALWATGDGAADKMSVAASMVAEHGIEFETDDESDAFVLAQIGLSILNPGRDTLAHRIDVVAAIAAQHKEITK